MDKKFYSTHDVARLCDAHYTTVINWVKSGKLKAYITPGKHRRINKEELEAFLNKYKMPLSRELKKKNKVILVVDDDIGALEEYKDAFEGNGFDFYFASSGFEAGKMAYKLKPDLILLDFRMPGMDGFEVCELLQKDKETSGIPVFAVTALRSEEDIARIKRCGVKQYVAKPVNIDNLLGLIKKTLGEKKKLLFK